MKNLIYLLLLLSISLTTQDVQWQNTIDGMANENGLDLIKTQDGVYVVSVKTDVAVNDVKVAKISN